MSRAAGFKAVEDKVAGVAGKGDEVATAGGEAAEGNGGDGGDGDEGGGGDQSGVCSGAEGSVPEWGGGEFT